jgi:glutathione synthase/RimK-type ligase-like ATP-grasp enzyme
MGNVVGRYLKEVANDEWHLNSMEAEGFEHIDKACIKAAEALKIDYVGFDVLSRGKRTFTILEANSAPILTEDAAAAIKTFIEV